MTQPYFSVGEEVILKSKDNPHLNGEYIIEDLKSRGLHMNPFKNNDIINVTVSYGYKLAGIDPRDTSAGTGYFSQSALRKKHQPPEDNESFSEIINNIKENLVVIER